ARQRVGDAARREGDNQRDLVRWIRIGAGAAGGKNERNNGQCGRSVADHTRIQHADLLPCSRRSLYLWLRASGVFHWPACVTRKLALWSLILGRRQDGSSRRTG